MINTITGFHEKFYQPSGGKTLLILVKLEVKNQSSDVAVNIHRTKASINDLFCYRQSLTTQVIANKDASSYRWSRRSRFQSR